MKKVLLFLCALILPLTSQAFAAVTFPGNFSYSDMAAESANLDGAEWQDITADSYTLTGLYGVESGHTICFVWDQASPPTGQLFNDDSPGGGTVAFPNSLNWLSSPVATNSEMKTSYFTDHAPGTFTVVGTYPTTTADDRTDPFNGGGQPDVAMLIALESMTLDIMDPDGLFSGQSRSFGAGTLFFLFDDLGGSADLAGTRDGDYDDFIIAATPSAVPVPGAVWLLGSGLMGLIGYRRKMRK